MLLRKAQDARGRSTGVAVWRKGEGLDQGESSSKLAQRGAGLVSAPRRDSSATRRDCGHVPAQGIRRQAAFHGVACVGGWTSIRPSPQQSARAAAERRPGRSGRGRRSDRAPLVLLKVCGHPRFRTGMRRQSQGPDRTTKDWPTLAMAVPPGHASAWSNPGTRCAPRCPNGGGRRGGDRGPEASSASAWARFSLRRPGDGDVQGGAAMRGAYAAEESPDMVPHSVAKPKRNR